MEYFKILLRPMSNIDVSGNTLIGNSAPSYNLDYYSHNNGQIGSGTLVSEYNVRSFLNDNRNQNIINEFISFLTGSTSRDELVYILGNDALLADQFNSFYSFYSSQNIPMASSIGQATNLLSITYFDNLYNWNGQIENPDYPSSISNASRLNKTKTGITQVSLNSSYFINVKINKSYSETSRNIFDLCQESININENINPLFEAQDSLETVTHENIEREHNTVEMLIADQHNKMRKVGKRSVIEKQV